MGAMSPETILKELYDGDLGARKRKEGGYVAGEGEIEVMGGDVVIYIVGKWSTWQWKSDGSEGVTGADQTRRSSEDTSESYREVKGAECDSVSEGGIEGRIEDEIEGRIRTCAFISVFIALNM